jgi:conjugative transposon TraK protein
MEFKSLTNIETSFRQIRLFALVFICLCALVTGFAVWNSYSFAEKQRQKIYVLDNGKSLMLALSQDMAQNRPVEAKSHVKRFHELFFTLSPDKGAIESNIKRSLFLADKSAFNYYKDLAEKGYYNRVISGNVTQSVEIDSVKCDFDQYPYKVNTYARQLIVRESSLTVRSLVTSCRLLNATRTASSSKRSPLPRTRICKPLRDSLMERERNYIEKAQDWADERLRRMCGRIAPGKRLAVILVMFFSFSGLSVYITVSSIYNIGKRDGQKLQIEHIKQLPLHRNDTINSIKPLNRPEYGRSTEE